MRVLLVQTVSAARIQMDQTAREPLLMAFMMSPQAILRHSVIIPDITLPIAIQRSGSWKLGDVGVVCRWCSHRGGVFQVKHQPRYVFKLVGISYCFRLCAGHVNV